MSRTQNAIKNTKYAMLSKMITMLLSFVARTVFINILGSTYLGVSGLYTEILSALSFAELGFGSALTYAMYAPIAKGDNKRITKLLAFYKHVYHIIIIVVIGIGLAVLPFLQYIVKGADIVTLSELRLYFLLYLTNTIITYLVAYKYSYVNALQETFQITKIEFVMYSSLYLVQIAAILLFKSFLWYLLIYTIGLLIWRFIISRYLDSKYPILTIRANEKITKEEKKPIYHEVRGLIVHQFSSVAVHQTDNILISSLSGLGVVAVGFVSNYKLLMDAVLNFVILIFNSVTPGFGNLVASSTKENFNRVFKTANFINFWVYGFCCIAFFILIPPFITIWIGGDKLIDSISFLLIIINCYFQGQCTIFNNARIAIGDFNKDKWWAFTQAVVNLIVSVWGAKQFGLVGIYIGTVASRLVFVIFRPMSTYRTMFDKSCIEYYGMLIKYFFTVLLAGGITYYITNLLLTRVSISSFLLSCCIVALLPNFIFFAFYFRSKEFDDVKRRLASIINGRKH